MKKVIQQHTKALILLLLLSNIFFTFVNFAFAQEKTYSGPEASIKDFLCTPTEPDSSSNTVFNNITTQQGADLSATDKKASQDLYKCINKLYRVSIAVAALTAVFFFVLAGYMYMSDSGNEKAVAKAKDMINSTVVGLIILLSTYILLRFINPDLVVIPSFQTASVADVPDPDASIFNTGTSTPAGGKGGPGALPPGGKCLKDACPKPDSFNPPLYDLKKNGLNCKNNCYIDPNFTQSVLALQSYLASHGGPPLRITEAYPPTSPHQSPTHYNGKTIDISPAEKSIQAFNNYCRALKAVGLNSFLNEATNEATECGPSKKTRFGDGPHIHVNLYK